MRNFLRCRLIGVTWLFCLSTSGIAGELTRSEAFDILEATRDLLPVERMQLSRCVASLGDGWKGAWQLVRNEIRYVPYEGTVRGAEGTLLCGEGNSLDQALLLAALLDHKGYRVRVCQAELPAVKRPSLQPPERKEGPSRLDELAQWAGLQPADIEALSLAARERARSATGFLLGRVGARYRQIEKAVGEFPASSHSRHETQHFWVQFESTAGTWTDLDPSAALEAGEHIQTPETTFPPDAIPERWVAVVTLRLILNDKEILSFSAMAAELCWKALSVGFIPADTAFKSTFDEDPSAMFEAFRKTERFQPMLSVESEFRTGRTFDLEGNVFEKIGDWRIASAQQAGRRIGGLLGGRTVEKKKPAPWSIRYELEFSQPGEMRKAAREIVVSGPPESVRMRLLSSETFLLIPGAVPHHAVAYRRLEHVLRNREFLEDTASGEFEPGTDWKRVSSEPLELLAFAQAETALLELLPQSASAFLPAHLVAWERRCDLGSAEGSLRTTEGIDILFAGIGTSLGGRQKVALGVRWGVTLTEIERRILETLGARHVRNAGRLFFLAGAQGVSFEVMRDQTAMDAKPYPEVFKKTLLAEFKGGRWAVVPTKGVPSQGQRDWGYYSIDPNTGETLGRMMDFRGQAMAEYAEMVDLYMGAVGSITSFADFMKCMVGTASMALQGMEQVEIRTAFCKCMISWGYSALTGGIKGLFDIAPSWGGIALDIALGGVPGTDFGGLNGALGKEIGSRLCGGGS